MRKILNSVLFSFLAISPLKSLDIDRGIDSYIMTDINDPLNKTKFEARSCFLIPTGKSYAVLSPRFSAYLGGNFDMNFGVGVRKPFPLYEFIAGYHVFYDFSFQRPKALHQGGFSAEFSKNNFEVRLNYYHPIDFFNKSNIVAANAQKWVEIESTYKFDAFSASIAPSYNFTSQKFSFKPKVTIPLKFFTVEAGATISQDMREVSSYIGIGIPLYKMGCQPVCRSSSVRHYDCPLYEKKNLNESL